MSRKDDFPKHLPISDAHHKAIRVIAANEEKAMCEIGDQVLAQGLSTRKPNRKGRKS